MMGYLHVMNDFMKSKYTIMNKASLKDGKLKRMGQAFHDRREAKGEDLRENPLDDIDHRDRPKMADIRGPHYLGDQGNHPKIEPRHDKSPNVELLKHAHDHR